MQGIRRHKLPSYEINKAYSFQSIGLVSPSVGLFLLILLNEMVNGVIS